MQELIEILNKVFHSKPEGTYLDIGAYDGVTDNVTNHFYELGWRGICIEPQTKYFKLGVANRPYDLWVKGVVVPKAHETKTVAFYETEDGQQSSTLSLPVIVTVEGVEYLKTKKKQLKAIKVNNDVPRNRFENGLDLMVIDTGEDDFEILQSIDLGLWKPNIVVAPIGYVADTGIRYMQTMGYYHLAEHKTGYWLVFSNNLEDSHNV